jgi:hypothetical protein
MICMDYDFRRVVVPLGEFGRFKSGFFNGFGVGVILDLNRGASGDLNFRPDSFHTPFPKKPSARVKG